MSGRVTRRGVVVSTVAGAGLLLGVGRCATRPTGDDGGPDAPGPGGTADGGGSAMAPVAVETVAASRLLADAAVAAHPTFRTAVYSDVDAWMSRLVELGVRRFRGLYDPANPGTAAAVEACRRHGVQWIMLVVPEADLVPTVQSLSTTRDVVRQIAATCPDVCGALEGVNEPNHNRGTTVPPPADWASGWTVPHQRVIWETARSEPALADVVVIGSSLHDAAAMASYRAVDPPGGERHYDQLARAGLGQWQDRLGLHSYPNGATPLAGLDQRLAAVRGAFGGGIAVHVTETGYVTATGAPRVGGPNPVSEEAMAAYVVRAALQLGARGLPWVWYELLDDPDPGAKDVAQANYGLWRVGSLDQASWEPKPAARALSGLLERLGGPGAASSASLDASSDGPSPRARVWAPPGSSVVCVVSTGGADGDVAHLFRDVSLFDEATRSATEPDAVQVVLSSIGGRQRLRVGGEVVSVALR